MVEDTLNDRLVVLEQEVARLRAKIDGERYGVIGRTSPDLLEMDFDRSLDDAMFDEVIQSILESRERERDEAEA